ncbi:MAG: hypothetical protein KDA80_04515 [Planctomycetaceae bacterium]|nr:hypothetical protein [Planctomycetaceae bacterium]
MTKLTLPKTGLVVEDGVLRLIKTDDQIVSEFPLADIRDIRYEKRYEILFPAILFLVFSGLAVACHTFIISDLPKWIWTILLGGVALFAFIGVEGSRIAIETSGGTVKYIVNDGQEEAQGFVLTLRNRLGQS